MTQSLRSRRRSQSIPYGAFPLEDPSCQRSNGSQRLDIDRCDQRRWVYRRRWFVLAAPPMSATSTVKRHHYNAFALHWDSEGLLIPELPQAEPSAAEATPSASITIREEDPQDWEELPPGRMVLLFYKWAVVICASQWKALDASELATQNISLGNGLI